MFFVIGNPENRRVQMFCDAAFSLGADVRVHSYALWLDGEPPSPAPHEIIRIESPGENFDVEQGLILLGDPDAKPIDDFGRIQFQNAWYAGFSTLLNSLPDQRFFNSPNAILSMFDKKRTNERFLTNQTPVAEQIAAKSFDELQAQFPSGRFFIKPRFGSSASGVVALSMKPGELIARTSVEIAPDGFYNQLHAKTYRDKAEVKKILAFVFSEGAVVERWVPKATLQNTTFDFRVVCINHVATHCVARQSTGPITNLHLGNSRADLDAIELAYPGATALVKSESENASRAFPEALYCGIDIALRPNGKTVVFEANAFGDLLPNVLYDGDDTYTTQIKTFL